MVMALCTKNAKMNKIDKIPNSLFMTFSMAYTDTKMSFQFAPTELNLSICNLPIFYIIIFYIETSDFSHFCKLMMKDISLSIFTLFLSIITYFFPCICVNQVLI